MARASLGSGSFPFLRYYFDGFVSASSYLGEDFLKSSPYPFSGDTISLTYLLQGHWFMVVRCPVILAGADCESFDEDFSFRTRNLFQYEQDKFSHGCLVFLL